MKNYTSSHASRIKAVLLMALLVLLSAANTLAQTRWQGNGTEQSPYLINNTDDLEALANSANSGTDHYGHFFRLNADLTYDTITQNNHTAIGTGVSSFRGTFDGNGHTISGIRISNNNDYQGLFGFCENCTVKNLILTNARICGKDNVGGIVGYNLYSSIEDCQVANNVNVSGTTNIGGIAGNNYQSSIEDCQVANNVNVSSSIIVGGIAGYSERGGSVENCQVANNVNVSGEFVIGGIMGEIVGQNAEIIVKDCQVTNNVTLNGKGEVGGIVGMSYQGRSSVENCLVANNVTISGSSTVSGSSTEYGGIMGLSEGSSIKDCQVANNVTISGCWGVGGIVGNDSEGFHNYNSSIEDCQVANNVTISGDTISGTYGTIVGHYNYNSTYHRNYYLDCTVNGVANATDVGTENGDITENNGAVPGYLLTLGEHITSAHAFTIPAYGEMPETTYQVAPSGDTITLSYELAGCEVTYYVNDNAIADSTFIMPADNVSVTATWEYIIHNATEWNNFCNALQDNDAYNRFIGKTVRLAADITVKRMAGSSTHDFMGTFDGQGHTLTLAYGTATKPLTEDYASPFRNVENGANIHNLHVGGHIYTSNKFASGIIGNQYGTVSVSNCRSSVLILSSKNGDGTHGGIVANQHGTLTVSGCVFDGRMLTTNGTTHCGGLVGYHSGGTCTISDCLYTPAEATLPSGLTYITDGATFCRNYDGTPANCYYTETLGEEQGKLAHSITLTPQPPLPEGEGVTMAFAGEATEYVVSGITTCGTGLQYGSMLYAGNEDQVSLTFTALEGFSVVAATYTPEGGTGTEITPVNGVFSFTMPDANVVIDAVTEYIIHDATEWNNFCDALQDNNTYNRFIGKTVRLANDISVTRMAGSSYHDFMGTFDGQGHTLTIAYGTAGNPISEEYAAPFRYVENGAIIHSLHVDGHIYTSNKYASGLAGCQYGTVTLNNCRSSVVIHSSKQGDGTHGGIVAVHHNTLTVSGCVYDGRLLTTNGTTLCGGLIGYHYGTITLSDCLYAPATDVTLASGETNITNGATFCRNYSGSFDNCYYTETLGTAQGRLVLANPAVSPVGEANATYDVSGLTLYGNGIQFGEVFYYDTERNFLRTIAGYGTGSGGWRLIASPLVEAVTPTEAKGFHTNACDLYRFNQAMELEWENWKDDNYDNYHFDLESGKGYLYAGQAEATLVFTGTPYSGNGQVTLTKAADATLSGWNLIGNPFKETAYLADGRPFYVMNDEGSDIIAATGTAIGAMEGVFVIANTDGETVTFTTAPRVQAQASLTSTQTEESLGSLAIEISRADREGVPSGVIDRAIIRFDEGEALPKLQMNDNSTRISITQDGKDYAVINLGRDAKFCVSTTEIPISFKAAENGVYTLSISAPLTSNLSPLTFHLIDTLTGSDIDLLATPTYTFEAKVTDDVNRFKLVFATK